MKPKLFSPKHTLSNGHYTMTSPAQCFSRSLKGTLALSLLFLAGSHLAEAQLSVTSANASYTQNFNNYNPATNLSNLTSTIPAGWTAASSATAAFQGQGTGGTGGYWGYGTGSDFSLGALRTGGTGNITYAASFTNNTGLTIQQLSLGWNYEQWRYANTSGWNVTGTGGLTSNTTLNNSDFAGVASGTQGSVTTTAVSTFNATSLSIANAGAFGLSWVTTDVTGADNGVSIDDFSMNITRMATAGATTTVTSLNYGSGVTIVNGHNAISTLAANISSTETFAGSIQNGGSNALSLSKTGAGTLTLGGSNTYTGSTTITTGTLALGSGGSISNSPTITVGSNTFYDVSAVSGGYSLASGQTLQGIGTVTGAMTVASGSTISPGTSPGNLNTGALTFASGGNYNWQILDATSTAGIGWDLITASGALNITATTGSKFNINLWSLSSTGPDVSGNATNFNNASNYAWKIVGASSITGFGADKFAINTPASNGAAGFSNGLNGGTFSVSQSGGDLNIVFTAADLGANLYWDGSGNWISSAPGAGGTGTWADSTGAWDPSKVANFSGTAAAVTVGSATANKGINFLADGYSLSGGTITLSATPADNVITVGSAMTATISSGISTSAGIIKSGAGKLVFDTAQSYSGGTTISGGTLQLGNGGATGSISGAITNNSALSISRSDDFTFGNTVSGSGTLTKLGSNTLTVSGGNSYAGTTSISAGALRATHATALGTTAAGTTVSSGAALELSGTISIGAEALSLSGTGVSNGGALRNISGDNSYGGTITIAATSSIKSDSDTLTLAGITGAAQNLTLGGSGNISAAGAITIGTLTKEGAGTTSLTGTLTGNLTVAGGAVNLGSTDRISDSSTVSISSGTLGMGTFNDTVGSFTITGGELAGTTGTLTAATYTLQGGTVNARLGAGAATVSSGTTTLGSADRLSSTTSLAVNSGQLSLGGNESIAAYTQSGGTLAGTGTLTATSYGLSGGTTSVGFAGSGAVTAASGTTNLNGNSTGFTGATTVSGGTLALGDNASLGNSAIAISSGSVLGGDGITTSNAITIGTAASTANNNFTVSWDFATASPSISNAVGFTIGAVTQGNNNGTTTMLGGTSPSSSYTLVSGGTNSGGNNAGAAAFAGAINTSSSTYFDFTLTKTSASTVSLNDIFLGSRSTSTGPQGIDIRATSALATSLGTASINNNSTWVALNPNLTNTDIGSASTFRIYGVNGTGTPSANTANWRIDDLTLQGVSTTSVAASGTGILGINTAGSTTYSGLITVNNTATLTAAASGTAIFSNSIGGVGAITKTGDGAVILEGANTYTGSTTISNGTLEVQGSLATSGITNNGALVFNSADDQVFSKVINGSGTLTKKDDSILTLSGTNTYTGATNVNAGTLLVNGNSSTANGAVTVATGATLGGNGTVGGATTISGEHSPGSSADTVGTQAFSSTLTYASDSIFNWDLNANSTSTGFDTVTATGAINASGAVFNVVLGAGVDKTATFWSTPGSTKTWALAAIFGQALTSTFSSVTVANTTPAFSALGGFTVNGSNLTWTAVPEPTSALAGLLLGAGLLRRRRSA
jgi:fibronectin-binding autotransporter adhesin